MKNERTLRIVKRASGGVSEMGVCERCNATFTATRNDANFIANKDEVRDKFEAHKCKPQDESQNAARIVREATDGK